jgi:hypothetical protein
MDRPLGEIVDDLVDFLDRRLSDSGGRFQAPKPPVSARSLYGW